MKLNYSTKINSDIRTAKETISRILDKMDNVDKNDLFDIKVILSELIVNGIIHGNKNDISKHIIIEISMDNNLLNIHVQDQGDGFNLQREIACEKLKACGRGLILVEGLSDDLTIEGNIVKVKKSLIDLEQKNERCMERNNTNILF